MRRKISIGVGVVVLLCAVALLVFGSAQSRGTIINHGDNAASKQPVKDRILEGQYVHFQYPGTYSSIREIAKGDSSFSASDLEIFRMDAGTAYPKLFYVEVKTFPYADLNAEPAFYAKLSQPNRYTRSQVRTADGKLAEIMTNLEDREEYGFVLEGSRLAIVSMTSSTSDESLHNAVKMILTSFRWKK